MAENIGATPDNDPDLLRAAFLAGFLTAGEGWNGEHPFFARPGEAWEELRPFFRRWAEVGPARYLERMADAGFDEWVRDAEGDNAPL